MTNEQRKAIVAYVTVAEWATRDADEFVYAADANDVDPELRGHVSIALQHLQMARKMLEEVQP